MLILQCWIFQVNGIKECSFYHFIILFCFEKSVWLACFCFLPVYCHIMLSAHPSPLSHLYPPSNLLLLFKLLFHFLSFCSFPTPAIYITGIFLFYFLLIPPSPSASLLSSKRAVTMYWTLKPGGISVACVEVTTLPAKLWQAPSTSSAMVSCRLFYFAIISLSASINDRQLLLYCLNTFLHVLSCQNE